MRRLFLFFFVVLVAPLVVAGLTPARYEVNYEPGLKAAFPFTFLSSNPEARFSFSLQGDFAQYAQLSDSTSSSTGTVIVYVTLPDEADVPGIHRVFVTGAETSSLLGLGISGEPRGVILIYVPYPGRYLEVSLATSSVNKGEVVPFDISVINRGKETTSFDVYLDIYRGEAFVERLGVAQSLLGSTDSAVFHAEIDSTLYSPGSYRVVAHAVYGEADAIDEKAFRIGTLEVHILNYTRFFERDSINKINLDIESAWNAPIENVFANVTVLGSDISFLTPTVVLSPFGRATLEGYFDTSSIVNDTFEARVMLFYEGLSSEQAVSLAFVKKINVAVVALVIAIVVVALLAAWFFVRRKRAIPRRRVS
ncbi:MAG: hypothetical protein AABX53_00305 [Nanoarchaeota archaeon]